MKQFPSKHHISYFSQPHHLSIRQLFTLSTLFLTEQGLCCCDLLPALRLLIVSCCKSVLTCSSTRQIPKQQLQIIKVSDHKSKDSMHSFFFLSWQDKRLSVCNRLCRGRSVRETSVQAVSGMKGFMIKRMKLVKVTLEWAWSMRIYL